MMPCFLSKITIYAISVLAITRGNLLFGMENNSIGLPPVPDIQTLTGFIHNYRADDFKNYYRSDSLSQNETEQLLEASKNARVELEKHTKKYTNSSNVRFTGAVLFGAAGAASWIWFLTTVINNTNGIGQNPFDMFNAALALFVPLPASIAMLHGLDYEQPYADQLKRYRQHATQINTMLTDSLRDDAHDNV